MSRARRLLDLIEIFRRHRFPVSGAYLAAELGVSLRTLYRDIGSLREQGAAIEGEAGLGYVLRPGFMLPPLMFAEEELEAMMLGARWVMRHGDARLADAARNGMARIAAVLPMPLQQALETSTLLIGSSPPAALADECDLPAIRLAIRRERKITIAYRDLNDRESRRVIWPFALGFFERVRVIAAWCELRCGFRHFRADRILSLAVAEQRYPRRRQALLEEWRAAEGIAAREGLD